MRLLLFGLIVLGSPLAAQGTTSTLVTLRQGAEVGRETFKLEEGRKNGRSGTTLTVSSRYLGAASNVDVLLERSPDGQLGLFQLDAKGQAGSSRILAAGSGARVILRTIAEGSEAGRELPGGDNVVLLDDQALALYQAVADLATPDGRRLSAIFPRSNRRAQFVATRTDAEGGARIALSGEITGSIRLDAGGKIRRLELPGQGVVATVE